MLKIKLFLLSIATLLMCACSNHNDESQSRYTEKDLPNLSYVVLLGSIQDQYVTKHYPNADVKRVSAVPDISLTLQKGLVDVAFLESTEMIGVKRNIPNYYTILDSVAQTPIGAAFNKENTALRDQFNEFVDGLKKEGKLDEIRRYWLEEDDGTFEMPTDIPVYTTGEPLRFACTGQDPGYAFHKNGKLAGFEAELAMRFAAYLKRPMETSFMDLNGLLAGLASRKVDMVADILCITPEREKSMTFSQPYATSYSLCIAADQSGENVAQSHTSWWDSIKESFINNLVKENRYLLILKGLGVTVLISICAAVLGTLLGGLICFMRMNRRKACTNVAKCYITLMRGIPILVFLMLMYYVFLAKLDLGGVVVAIIAFAMNFAAYVSEMFRTSIEGVDRGQTEAGIAMGFTPVQTFVNFIMPQAARTVLPVYKGELIGLVKNTSVVGYIAVEDLTKASDLIRSRTFDAFFPLLFSALLYFLLAWLLTALLEKCVKTRKV